MTRNPQVEALRLDEAVAAIGGCLTLEQLGRAVVRHTRALADADGAALVLRDGTRCHYVDEEAIAPMWKGQRFPSSICISGWAMTHREPAIVTDSRDDPRIPYNIYRVTFVRSLVMVPMLADEPLGSVGAYWATPGGPTAERLELVSAVAAAAAGVLSRLAR